MHYSPDASERSFEILSAEGLRHLVHMGTALEKIWAKRPQRPEQGFVVINDREMATAIFEFVTDFGYVSTILFDDGPKRTSENSAVHRIRRERTERVLDFFADIDTSIFKDRRIRNRYQHIDEYVAKELVKHPDSVIIQDLAFDRREVFSSALPMLYIRVYEFSTDTLLHVEAEFDVKKLYETSLLMIAKLQESNQPTAG